jgi:replicative DNA helicase
MIQETLLPQDDITRPLPHAVGSEKYVLSCMLADPANLIPQAIESGLHSDDFYSPFCSTLYAALTEYYEAVANPADIELIGLVQRLHDRGQLSKVGGAAEVTEVFTYARSVTESQMTLHANILREKSIARGIIRAANQAVADIYHNPGDPRSALDALDASLTNLREGHQTEGPQLVQKDVELIADELVAALQEHRLPKRQDVISTGFANINDMTDGLIPGEVFVIAARPSVGKTSLMMNIVEHVAVDLHMPTLVFSLEMPRKAVVMRVLYGRARYALKSYAAPNKVQLTQFKAATMQIRKSPLWIEDRSAISIQAFKATARRMHRKHNIRFLAVDYLQLMRSTSKQAQGSREREIAEISAGIKATAKELNIPVLILSQLNRDVEKRTGGKEKGRPRLSDLRESGSLEQDADVVGMLWRKDYGLSGDEKEEVIGQAMLSIMKNRNGPVGDCHLKFHENICRFEKCDPPQSAENEAQQKRIKSRHEP